MIACTCGESDCKGMIWVDNHCFWVSNHDGKEVMVYLDANAKVALIRELHLSLVPEELKRP